MKLSELEILSILEALSIFANAIAVITALILSITVLMRSVHAKINGTKVDSEEFASHLKIVEILKSCSRYGFVFQFLGWLMFTSKQKGFVSLPVLTNSFALLWGVACVITIVLGIFSRLINGKETKNVVLGRKITWMMWCSVLYAVVTFLIK